MCQPSLVTLITVVLHVILLKLLVEARHDENRKKKNNKQKFRLNKRKNYLTL